MIIGGLRSERKAGQVFAALSQDHRDTVLAATPFEVACSKKYALGINGLAVLLAGKSTRSVQVQEGCRWNTISPIR